MRHSHRTTCEDIRPGVGALLARKLVGWFLWRIYHVRHSGEQDGYEGAERANGYGERDDDGVRVYVHDDLPVLVLRKEPKQTLRAS